MFAYPILALLALQPSSTGEDSLVWTELTDPDPHYVPPPPSAEELAYRRAEQLRLAERRRLDDEYRRAEANVDAQLRRAEQAIRNACEAARQAIGPHPACSR